MVSRAQQKKLTVWWNRGYYKEEDEAMLKIAEDFRKAKNVDLDISFTIQEDLLKKTISAMTARRCPDVAYCFYNDWEVIPKYAWEGRLVETTDIINELKPRYIEKFLPVAYVLRQHGQEARVLRCADRGPDHANPLLERSPQGGGHARRPRQDPHEVGRVLGVLEEGAGQSSARRIRQSTPRSTGSA